MSASVLTEVPVAPVSPTSVPASRRCNVNIEDKVVIPAWVNDLESYRRWARSEGYPDHGWYSFLDGEIWVNLNMEEFFPHNQVKTEHTAVLAMLVRGEDQGYFVADRMLLTHPGINLSTEPDGLFASWEAFQGGRLRLVAGESGGFLELEGAPDMVLEIISRTSMRKDSEILRDLYWRAGIAEYWLVDVRSEEPRFEILQHAAEGYVSDSAQDGWLPSRVFGRPFRLGRQTDPLGHPKFRLETQPA